MSMSRPGPRLNNVAGQRGVTMVEVLVAMLITAMGVLSLAGLMATATRFGKTSEFRAVASLQVADIADRMRVNLAGLASYSASASVLTTSAPASAAACASSTACTSDEIAAIDVATWKRSVFNALPSGTVYLTVTDQTNRLVDVWVIWKDPGALSGTDADAAGGQYFNAADSNNQACPPNIRDLDPEPRCMYFRLGL